VHLLIQAFSELALPNAELILIGGMTPEIQSVLSKHKDARIVVRGTIPQRELFDCYSQGSVFCINSIQDGFGMVLPEAMSCGLPVIASNNVGAADLIDDGITGFVIAAGDIEALKGKLLHLYTSPTAREQMAHAVAAHPQRDLSWDRYGEAISEAYERILRSTKKTIDSTQS
jgi:glycosyltransferase involved in cell wall biosynthesis